MSIPIASQSLRSAWQQFDNSSVIRAVEERGLSVRLVNAKNRHFKIAGGLRPVELYASTGTVNACQSHNLKPYSAKQMAPLRAIERLVSLAIFGH
jgi:hypothetical protein